MAITKLISDSLGAGVGGKVLQVVQAVKTDTFTTTSGTFVDITGITVSITPSSSSNKILVDVRIGGYNPSATCDCWLRLDRAGTTLQVGTTGTGTAAMIAGTPVADRGDGSLGICFLDSPSTTSSTAYKLQGAVSGGTLSINSKSGSYSTISTITVMEVSA
jgi:hypothetical protein